MMTMTPTPDGSKYKKFHDRLEGYKNDLKQAGYEEVSIHTPIGNTSRGLD